MPIEGSANPDFEVLVVGPSHGGGIVSYIDEQTDRLAGRVGVSVHDSGAPPAGSGTGRFLYGILLALLALLFGPAVVKRLGKKAGRTAGATQQARTEFEKGREE
jgi:hypothetical protein